MDIVYLADHREIIPTIAQWFYGEWAYLYSDRTFADVEPLIGGRANAPVALVVFEAQGLFGTVCLKVHDTDTRSDLTVWLADFYASAAWRRKSNRITLLLGPPKAQKQRWFRPLSNKPTILGWKSCICIRRNPTLFMQNVDGTLKNESYAIVVPLRLCRRKSFSNTAVNPCKKLRYRVP